MRREQLEATGALPEELGEPTQEQLELTRRVRKTGEPELTGAAHPEQKKGEGKTFEDEEVELTGGIFREIAREFAREDIANINRKHYTTGARKLKGQKRFQRHLPVYGYSKGHHSTCPNPFSQRCEMCGATKYVGIQHKCKNYMAYLLGRKQPVIPRHKQANFHITYSLNPGGW